MYAQLVWSRLRVCVCACVFFFFCFFLRVCNAWKRARTYQASTGHERGDLVACTVKYPCVLFNQLTMSAAVKVGGLKWKAKGTEGGLCAGGAQIEGCRTLPRVHHGLRIGCSTVGNPPRNHFLSSLAC